MQAVMELLHHRWNGFLNFDIGRLKKSAKGQSGRLPLQDERLLLVFLQIAFSDDGAFLFESYANLVAGATHLPTSTHTLVYLCSLVQAGPTVLFEK
jgi:hypothetical protein